MDDTASRFGVNSQIFMKKCACLLLLVLPFLWVHSQARQGKWLQADVTIGHADLDNNFLARNAFTTCYICDETGKRTAYGRYLRIYDHSRDTLYYRGSAKGLGNYVNQSAPGFVATVSNMSQYYPVYPGQPEIIHIDGYEDAKSRKRYMDLIIDFKYFHRAGTTPASTANSTNTSGHTDEKTFYVFFTANIAVKPKGAYSGLQSSRQVFVISVPILHKGQLTDPLIQEKEDFLKAIDLQMEDKPEDLLQKLRADDFQDVTVHYGQPYSTVLLTTPDEATQAIEACKQAQRDLLQGIAVFDFLQLH